MIYASTGIWIMSFKPFKYCVVMHQYLKCIMFQSLLTKIFFEFIIIITIKINKQEFSHWVSINDHTNVPGNYKPLCIGTIIMLQYVHVAMTIMANQRMRFIEYIINQGV